MDKKSMIVVVMSVFIAIFAINAVTALSWAATTPLYTVRMEQASNKMNFLPTGINEFTYVTEKGYTMNCEVSGFCSTNSLDYCTEYGTTCLNTCPFTCEHTCPDTCKGYTCDDTSCQSTCDTCLETCPCTISCGPTCQDSCDYGSRCPPTYWVTCGSSCDV